MLNFTNRYIIEEQVYTKTVDSSLYFNRYVFLIDRNNMPLFEEIRKSSPFMNSLTKENNLKYYMMLSNIEENMDMFERTLFICIGNINPDKDIFYSNFFLKMNQQAYFRNRSIRLNYIFIGLAEKTFIVNRSAETEELFTDGKLNLIAKGFYDDKSSVYIFPKNGIQIFTGFNTPKVNFIVDKFVDSIRDFIIRKGYNCDYHNNDLVIDNRKFFGSCINEYRADNYFCMFSSIGIVTRFEPEKDFFFNVMHYEGKNTYTGLLEEVKDLKEIDIYNLLFDFFINKCLEVKND